MFLLDTNVVSELRPGKKNAEPQVLAWAAGSQLSSYYLSSVTVFELELGILRLERTGQGTQLRAWFNGLRNTFQGRVLPFAEQAALLCANMHVPDPKSYRDAMIASIALEHGFVVVTRNTEDFLGTGVRLLNPWESA
ncbi:plasmid stability protein [Bordetella ansorpii]|uniref:Plasmid stability protein n=1 Tax=Bordetella ansorpii TaxID=288768 RepID=A0A157QNJ5_9BORD|nr:type II toxin-antitoxin system VapC family toxin [Bordetella ansorpii]SAI47164.1 plasmid stability protein [Bordetella ansorpii]